MPTSEGLAIFNAWGLIAGIGMPGIFVAGFFIVPWWMPFTAWLSGQIAYRFVPLDWRSHKGPGVGFLATLAGIGCSVSLLLI